ncbi:MAG: 3-hydroxyacyl-CoA dehydrogenase/enoyl-CoA hydratase family protein [Pseudomonadota bacterium]
MTTSSTAPASADAPYVRQVAVLGAGVMGAQIAAHLTNAGIPTLLYELPAEGADPNANAAKAIKMLAKLKPAPLATKAQAKLLRPANYQSSLELLTDCDLVIEAVAERMDIKRSLYEQVAPHLNDRAIFASNTSGLSITELANAVPEALRARFAGVHFFNPPRYMHLVELIPHAGTDERVLTNLESFLTHQVGKGVVRAKDTPNFIGNRIGVFSILSTLAHTAAYDLGFDTVDALTGPALGRPKSATYRTSDVVGLDTMAHVVATMTHQLPDDPWAAHFKLPDWYQGLLDQGALGQKTRAGIYRKTKAGIEVLDPKAGAYRPSEQSAAPEVAALLKERDPAKRLAALRASDHPQAQFLWALHRDLFHYCAYHLADIADSAREVDFAIRWGYGWKLGPFELWQACGWRQVAQWIREDIDAGRTLSSAPLPEWVEAGDRQSVHSASGSFSASRGTDVPRNDKITRRQARPQLLLGEPAPQDTVIEETDDIRLWTLDHKVLIASFKTKRNTFSPGVLAGLRRAADLAEGPDWHGLVVWQTQEPFSFGADLSGATGLVASGNVDGLRDLVATFQNTMMRLKYCGAPVVAAIRGMALGGGCELALQSDRIVAAHETYIGLVEAGVGLLPGGGGCKELAIRAADATQAGDRFAQLAKYFENVAMAKVAASAHEAREWGFLREGDQIVMHPDEILHAALAQAKAMHAAGYRPPHPWQTWPVQGRFASASLKANMVNMLEGHFISEHDYEIGSRIADALCGGDLDPGTVVDEEWLLRVEREHFVALTLNKKTQARIMHTLETGKPLRN